MTTTIDDAVLMTLAGIAYGAPDRIAGYVAEAKPTAGTYDIVWSPVVEGVPDNFAFIAKAKGADSYVIAIRGTYPNPFSPAYWHDGDQDSPFGDMVDWPGADGAKLSAGTSTGFENLKALKDSGGATIADFVKGAAGAVFTVTGHSLGGTLTPVLALYLKEQGAAVEAVSYAGLTPGNEAFADLFGEDRDWGGKARRVFNSLDTVSYGWDNVWATHKFYQPAPAGGLVVEGLLAATVARLKLGGYDFAAVGAPCELTGVLKDETIDCEIVAYVFENLHQHMPDTYLALLGAPPLPFSLLFGAVVAPRADGAAASPHSPPVTYAT